MSFFGKLTAIVHAPILLPLVTTLAAGAIVYRVMNPPQQRHSSSSGVATQTTSSQNGSVVTTTPSTLPATTPSTSTDMNRPQVGNQVSAYSQNRPGAVPVTILPRDTSTIYGQRGRAPAQANPVGATSASVAIPVESAPPSAGGTTVR